MKLAMVVPGGVDRSGTHRVVPYVLALIERFARVHELHVFALGQEPRPARWRLLGAEVHNAGLRPAQAVALGQILREHRRAPFDVLHGMWAAPGGVVAGIAGRLLRRPVLTQLLGGDVAAVPDIGYGLCLTAGGRARLRLAARLASRVIINSGYMRDLAAARGIDAEPIVNGVSLQDWPPLAPRRREVDAEARLLFAGTLNAVKDPGTILRAAARLRERGLRFRLDLVGEDTRRGELERLAAELNLDGIAHFHGFQTQTELRGWMERADLLLLASRHEGGPLVLLEAAVCGVPTVGTPVGHLADWAPEAAVTVPMVDPEAMAAAVAELLGDEDRRLALAAAAQRLAIRHDADAGAGRILEIFAELAAGRGAR